MNKYISILALFLLPLAANGQVDFRNITTSEEMDQVWEDAVAQNKPVFVDIYATWCGPCKWLDANVFALEEAGNYMNDEFINVKMDGESDFGRVFAMKSGLSAYPSLFLFNSEQKQMNMLVGAKPWDELKAALASTLEYFPVLEMLQSKFESNLLGQEEYPRFAAALREMGKESYGDAVANKYKQDYIKGSDRTAADIQVLAYYTEQNTEEWNHLISDIALFRSAMGDQLEDFIDYALTEAIEFSVQDADPVYIRELNSILPELSQGTSLDPGEMETRSYVYYYHYSGLIDELITYIDDNYAERKGDHRWLFNAASDAVFLDPQNKKMASKGLEWFNECLSRSETQEYYYHLALCQYFTDSPEEAAKSLKKSLEFTEDPEVISTTNSIIQQIEGE